MDAVAGTADSESEVPDLMGRRSRSVPEGPDHGGAKDAPLTLVPRAPVVGPVIEITPTPDEYDQLVHDLARLREHGAASNTAAVVAAVHAAARDRMRHGKHENAGRR
jgi:hypothetical protein